MQKKKFNFLYIYFNDNDSFCLQVLRQGFTASFCKYFDDSDYSDDI